MLTGAHDNLNSLERALVTRVADFVSAMNDVTSRTASRRRRWKTNSPSSTTRPRRRWRISDRCRTSSKTTAKRWSNAAAVVEQANRSTTASVADRKSQLESLVSTIDLRTARILKLDHDFIGRVVFETQLVDGTADANRKVTLVWNRDDTAEMLGSMFDEEIGAKYFNLPLGNYATYQYDRVESTEGSYLGRSNYVGYSANVRSVLSIAVVDASSAEPGTEVVVLWGEGTPSSKVQVEDHRQIRIRATVQPAPLVAKARTDYRSNAVDWCLNPSRRPLLQVSCPTLSFIAVPRSRERTR